MPGLGFLASMLGLKTILDEEDNAREYTHRHSSQSDKGEEAGHVSGEDRSTRNNKKKMEKVRAAIGKKKKRK